MPNYIKSICHTLSWAETLCLAEFAYAIRLLVPLPLLACFYTRQGERQFGRCRVEGLLTKGAMRADDRPLWFDVYRAFPPLAEPKFAKPKPETKPIRQILYPEDTLRAEFHSHGHGLGTISMISQTETQTKRLIQQYEKLKSERVPKEDLIEKSAAVVGSERQIEYVKAKATAQNPDSITAKVLADADIKNIFSEK